MSSRPEPLTAQEAGILNSIPFSHIRGELHLFSNQCEKQYAILSGESGKSGLPAEICLFFGNDPQAELERFFILYFNRPIPVRRILVYSGNAKVTANSILSIITPAIRREFPGIATGAGTNCNFAQLNRSRPDFKDIDLVTFAIHPQEHATDERTLVENTAAQYYAVQNAIKFEINKPVIVSPVTLQRRFNANRENYEVPGDGLEVPLGLDPRQMSLFGAAWTVGSLKYLLDSCLTSITYYETVGERGLFMGEHESRWPSRFNAQKGIIFPVFHVFRMLMNKGIFRVPGSHSTNPLVIDGFTVAGENSGFMFLSNMTRQKQSLKINGTAEYRELVKMNPENFNITCRNFQLPILQNQFRLAAKSVEILQPYETLILEYRF